MKYVFYADIFVLTNAYLDFLAIYSVSEVLQQKKRIRRYLVGAILGSISSCLLILWLKTYTMYMWCMHILVNPGMILFCFFPNQKKIYIKAYGWMYLLLFLEGGFVEWIYHSLLQYKFYEGCVLLTGIPVGVFIYIMQKKRRNVQMFYDVEIIQGEKRVGLRALYDTGNRLWDPYTRQPVQILSKEIYETVWGEEECKIRLIPFSTVGNKEGVLEAFTVEELRIDKDADRQCICPAVIAVAKQNIFGHGEYQMILHSHVFEK